MEILKVTLWITFGAASGVVLMSLVAPSARIRELLERAMMVVQGPPAMLRDGCRVAVHRAWATMQHAGQSVGIAGEHWIQRLVGSIIIPLAGVLGLIVGVLGLMAALGGALDVGVGDGSQPKEASKVGADATFWVAWLTKIKGHLHTLYESLDLLGAIELSAAAFLFGWVLLDILGITHTIKYYAKETLSKRLRWIFGSVCLVGALYSFWLFADSGVTRREGVASVAETSAAQAGRKASDLSTVHSYMVVGDAAGQSPLHGQDTSSVAEESKNAEDSPRYTTAVGRLMIGVPLVSIVSGVLASVGFIPAVGLVLTFPLFLACSALFGSCWVVGTFLVRMIDLVYSFAAAFVDFFAELGQSIRQLVTNRTLIAEHEPPQPPSQVSGANGTPDPSTAQDSSPGQHEPPSPRQEPPGNPALAPAVALAAGIPKPATGQPTADLSGQSLYAFDDPNWNPL